MGICTDGFFCLQVTCVAAGPGGDHFASCGHDKTVRVWNRAGGFIDDGSHSNGSKDKKLKKSSKRRKGEDEGESLFYHSQLFPYGQSD